jgi:hypothetical protein
MKLEFCRQIFGKHSYVKFDENPSSGSRVAACGQKKGRTDRYDEVNSRFSQFYKRALKRNHLLFGLLRFTTVGLDKKILNSKRTNSIHVTR